MYNIDYNKAFFFSGKDRFNLCPIQPVRLWFNKHTLARRVEAGQEWPMRMKPWRRVDKLAPGWRTVLKVTGLL